MKSYYILFTLMCFLTIGCETSNGLDYASLEATTGLNFTDANGSPIGFWGNPNDKIANANIFPNPSNGIFFLFAQEGIEKVWIVPSECVTDLTTDIAAMIGQVAYDVSDIEGKSEMMFDLENIQNNLSIDLSSFTRGTYKVFFQIPNGEIFWSSLYIDPSQSSFPDPGIIDFCN